MNLPAEPTSFVGRAADLKTVARLLSAARLVTVVGAPGVGKTRLALRFARRARRRFPDGVWFVELAAVGDPGLLPCTVAQAVGLQVVSGDPLDQLSEFLRDRRVLLVLDNCEHLARDCAVLASALLRVARRLHILATSRHMLQAAGEHLVELPPLPVYDEAVELFTTRAVAAAPAFAVTPENASDVAAVCRRLEGIPLAIELAAVQAKVMSPRELLAGLDHQFEVLGDAPSRVPQHRTMRAAIDWSYQLCEPAERSLWARLTTFAGEFDLDAAEEIGASGGIDAGDVFDLLHRLVGKSILVPGGHAGTVRYRMLEPLRQYGDEALSLAGEQREVRRRHADRYLRLAEEGERDWFGPTQHTVLERLDREHDELRTALRAFLDPPDAGKALRLAAALWFHWFCSGRETEGRIWLDRALALPAEPSPQRARALWSGSFLANIEGDTRAAGELAGQALELAERFGDEAMRTRALVRLGVIAVYQGDPARGSRLLRDALSRQERAPVRDYTDEVFIHIALSIASLARGDNRAGLRAAECARDLCRQRGDRVFRAVCLVLLARAEWLGGNLARAAEHTAAALRAHLVPSTTAIGLEQFASIAVARGDHRVAAVVLGAADHVRRRHGLTRVPYAAHLRPEHVECLRQVRATLAETVVADAIRRGQRMAIDDIVGWVVEQADKWRPGTPDNNRGS